VAESLDTIYQNMKQYSTEELHAIWNEGETGQWTPSTLEIVSLILRDRGEGTGADLGGHVSIGAETRAAELPAVRVVDVKMPFTSMIGFILKWTFAAIPALIIVTLLVVAVLIALNALGAPIPSLL
jgi:hypothetical protein